MGRKEFEKLYLEEGDTGVVYLTVEGGSAKAKKNEPVMIDDVQLHPVSGVVQHVVFRRVNLNKPIIAEIPIVLMGEVNIPGSNVIQVRDSIEVSALPTNLPEEFEIDISSLAAIGDALSLADLQFDAGKIELIFTGDVSLESPIVLVQEFVEEAEPEETSVDDVVVGEKDAKTEGDGAATAAGDAPEASESKAD